MRERHARKIEDIARRRVARDTMTASEAKDTARPRDAFNTNDAFVAELTSEMFDKSAKHIQNIQKSGGEIYKKNEFDRLCTWLQNSNDEEMRITTYLWKMHEEKDQETLRIRFDAARDREAKEHKAIQKEISAIRERNDKLVKEIEDCDAIIAGVSRTRNLTFQEEKTKYASMISKDGESALYCRDLLEPYHYETLSLARGDRDPLSDSKRNGNVRSMDGGHSS